MCPQRPAKGNCSGPATEPTFTTVHFHANPSSDVLKAKGFQTSHLTAWHNLWCLCLHSSEGVKAKAQAKHKNVFHIQRVRLM